MTGDTGTSAQDENAVPRTFQIAAGRAPEADDAVGRLADWVRPKLGMQSAVQIASAH